MVKVPPGSLNERVGNVKKKVMHKLEAFKGLLTKHPPQNQAIMPVQAQSERDERINARRMRGPPMPQQQGLPNPPGCGTAIAGPPAALHVGGFAQHATNSDSSVAKASLFNNYTQTLASRRGSSSSPHRSSDDNRLNRDISSQTSREERPVSVDNGEPEQQPPVKSYVSHVPEVVKRVRGS